MSCQCEKCRHSNLNSSCAYFCLVWWGELEMYSLGLGLLGLSMYTVFLYMCYTNCFGVVDGIPSTQE